MFWRFWQISGKHSAALGLQDSFGGRRKFGKLGCGASGTDDQFTTAIGAMAGQRAFCVDAYTLLKRSAMRVCQPGPEARQRSMTSAGKRKEMGLRGLADKGRPPLFKLARDNMSSVSSGKSSYSAGAMACASTCCNSDRKERRNTGFFTVIGFPHTKNMAIRATRCISHHHHPACKQTKANDPGFTVVLPRVLDLQGHTRKHDDSVCEI